MRSVSIAECLAGLAADGLPLQISWNLVLAGDRTIVLLQLKIGNGVVWLVEENGEGWTVELTAKEYLGNKIKSVAERIEWLLNRPRHPLWCDCGRVSGCENTVDPEPWFSDLEVLNKEDLS